jgi:iron complex outermembrane recepter protein
MKKRPSPKHPPRSCHALPFQPLALAAMTLVWVGVASAQTSGDADAVQSVVVTGTKRKQAEQQVSQSVNVLTQGELANEVDAFDAMLRLPNITSNSRGELPTVRGVDGSGVATGGGAAVSGGRPRFTTYVDGVARGHSFSSDGSASLWDVRQVEVYRGSQSSTLGRNASAGAMVITTIDPAFKNEGAVRLGYRSERAAWSGAAMLNRALSEDFAVRLTAEGLDGTNWRNPIHPSLGGRSIDDLEAQEFRRVRLKALWVPNSMPALSVRLAHDNQRDAASNAPDLISGPDFKRREVDELQTYSYFVRKNATTSAQVGYDFGGGWAFDGVLAHQRSSNDSVPAVSGDALSLQVYSDSTENSFEPKLNYAAGRGSRTSAVVGAFVYSRSRTEGGAPGTAFVYDAKDKVKTLSLFGDARVQLSDAWDLLAGMRLEREKQTRNLSGIFLGTFPAELALDETVKAVLPKLGVEYQLSPDMAVGALGYTGYQAPGGGVDFLGSGGAYTYGKEKARTAELTWRSRWLQRTLTINANVFDTRYRDYQIFGADPGGGFIVKNAARVSIRGLELEANWQPSKGITAFAQLGLLRSKIDKFDDADNSYINGYELPEAPKRTARVGGSFDVGYGVAVGGDVLYSASYYSDPENISAVLVPSFTTVNMNASWKFSAVKLTAYVNNLTDKFYLTGKLYPDSFKPRGYAAPPRTVGVSAQVNF